MNWDAVKDARVAARMDSAEDPPQDSFSAKEYADRYMIAYRTAHTQLNRMVELGLLARARKGRTVFFWVNRGVD